MESCWDCEIKQRSNEFDQMCASAEARNDAQGLRRIKGQHRRFLEAAYTFAAYDRQDGYSVHRDRWLETGDLAEIDKMLSHALPDDIWMKTESTGIKIIPLKPKAHHRRTFGPTDLYMITVVVVWIIAILVVHWAW